MQPRFPRRAVRRQSVERELCAAASGHRKLAGRPAKHALSTVSFLYRLGPHSGAFMWLLGLCEKESTMKFVLLCAAMSFVVWTAPARAEELCIGPACVGTGEHRDRDRDEGR